MSRFYFKNEMRTNKISKNIKISQEKVKIDNSFEKFDRFSDQRPGCEIFIKVFTETFAKPGSQLEDSWMSLEHLRIGGRIYIHVEVLGSQRVALFSCARLGFHGVRRTCAKCKIPLLV